MPLEPIAHTGKETEVAPTPDEAKANQPLDAQSQEEEVIVKQPTAPEPVAPEPVAPEQAPSPEEPTAPKEEPPAAEAPAAAPSAKPAP